MTIFREEATTVLAGFHLVLPSCGPIGKWGVNFCGGRRTREPGGKPSEQSETQQQTKPFRVEKLSAQLSAHPQCPRLRAQVIMQAAKLQ